MRPEGKCQHRSTTAGPARPSSSLPMRGPTPGRTPIAANSGNRISGRTGSSGGRTLTGTAESLIPYARRRSLSFETTMSESLDIRRKRLRHRCRYRGTKELDVLLGSFAEAHLESFDADQLGRFETLLDVPEPLILSWLTRQEPPPTAFDTDVLRLLLGHCSS